MKTRKRAAWRKWWPAVLVLAIAPGLAMAEVQFAEFQGVPEQLAGRALAIDCDWLWAALLLLVVVVALWAYLRRDRSK